MRFNTTVSIDYCVYKCCGMAVSTGHSINCKYYFNTALFVNIVNNSTTNNVDIKSAHPEILSDRSEAQQIRRQNEGGINAKIN